MTTLLSKNRPAPQSQTVVGSPTTRTVKIRYRPDIDGLRAVAVLLVIFDHLQTRVTGGYIGVDVFFVISGYLISAHILSEINAGRFSVVGFYERRPAYLPGTACDADGHEHSGVEVLATC